MDNIRSSRPQSLRFAPAIALALAAVVLASFAAITLQPGRGGSRRRTGHPTTERGTRGRSTDPDAQPQCRRTSRRPHRRPAPTPEPTDVGSDAMPIRVDLITATDADVYVDIVDRTGLLVDAASGTPGDGASIEAYTVTVENLGPTTLRLSWVDYPIDNALALYIDPFEDGFRLVLVQPEPTGPTDAMGVDRELVLTFSEPISASQVEAFLQGGLDTPG